MAISFPASYAVVFVVIQITLSLCLTLIAEIEARCFNIEFLSRRHRVIPWRSRIEAVEDANEVVEVANKAEVVEDVFQPPEPNHSREGGHDQSTTTRGHVSRLKAYELRIFAD